MRSLFFLASALFLNALTADVPEPDPAPFFSLDLQVRPEINYDEKQALIENTKTKTDWKSLLDKKRLPVALPLILAVIGLATWVLLKKPESQTIDKKKLELDILKERLEKALEVIIKDPLKENLPENFIRLDKAFRNLCFFLYGPENRWPDIIQKFFLEHEEKLNAIKFANALPDKQTLSDYMNFCRLRQ